MKNERHALAQIPRCFLRRHVRAPLILDTSTFPLIWGCGKRILTVRSQGVLIIGWEGWVAGQSGFYCLATRLLSTLQLGCILWGAVTRRVKKKGRQDYELKIVKGFNEGPWYAHLLSPVFWFGRSSTVNGFCGSAAHTTLCPKVLQTQQEL